MLTTGIYLRVSTDEQAQEGYSIRAQEEKLRNFAAAKDWPVFGIYADEGISGKDVDGRPELKRLIADVAAGKVKNVLVYKIDRLTRSVKNLIELVELFSKHSCAFNSLNEAIDTTTATGRMFLKLIGLFAEFERENLADRVRMGLERKVREGYTLCSFNIPSYGYSREVGERVQEVDEEEAEIVRRVFDMYLNDDYAYTKIAKILNAEAVRTKRGKRWHQRTIRLILTNPNYVGKVRYSIADNTRYFEADGHHEPIIDEEMFERVQAKIRGIKRVARTKRPNESAYFCGVLYCRGCGGKLSTKWQYPKGRFLEHEGRQIRQVAYPSYQCIKAGKYGECTAKAMSHIKMERAFEAYIERYADFSAAEDVSVSSALPAKRDHGAEIAEISAQLAQIEERTGEAMGLFMAGTINFETYQGMTAIGDKRRAELTERLEFLQNEGAVEEIVHPAREIALNIRDNWVKFDNAERQRFVQRFIKKIEVHAELHPNGFWSNVVIDGIEFNEF